MEICINCVRATGKLQQVFREVDANTLRKFRVFIEQCVVLNAPVVGDWNRKKRAHKFRLGPQDFFHGFAFCQFIHQFVEIAYFAHRWFLDFFDAHTTDDAFDQGS